MFFLIIDWFCFEWIERIASFVGFTMLERRGFDDVVTKVLEVSRHTWDHVDVGYPTMKGRKEIIGLGG